MWGSNSHTKPVTLLLLPLNCCLGETPSSHPPSANVWQETRLGLGRNINANRRAVQSLFNLKSYNTFLRLRVWLYTGSQGDSSQRMSLPFPWRAFQLPPGPELISSWNTKPSKVGKFAFQLTNKCRRQRASFSGFVPFEHSCNSRWIIITGKATSHKQPSSPERQPTVWWCILGESPLRADVVWELFGFNWTLGFIGDNKQNQ